MYYKLLLNALLFALLVPGVLVTLPPGGSRMTVLAVHAVVFALVSSYAMRMMFPRR
jgi:hypothetical protein